MSFSINSLLVCRSLLLMSRLSIVLEVCQFLLSQRTSEF